MSVFIEDDDDLQCHAFDTLNHYLNVDPMSSLISIDDLQKYSLIEIIEKLIVENIKDEGGVNENQYNIDVRFTVDTIFNQKMEQQ